MNPEMKISLLMEGEFWLAVWDGFYGGHKLGGPTEIRGRTVEEVMGKIGCHIQYRLVHPMEGGADVTEGQGEGSKKEDGDQSGGTGQEG